MLTSASPEHAPPYVALSAKQHHAPLAYPPPLQAGAQTSGIGNRKGAPFPSSASRQRESSTYWSKSIQPTGPNPSHDNLLVQIHFIIVMMRWTGLAPWEFEFPFPGSLTSTKQALCQLTSTNGRSNFFFQVVLHLPSRYPYIYQAGTQTSGSGNRKGAALLCASLPNTLSVNTNPTPPQRPRHIPTVWS